MKDRDRVVGVRVTGGKGTIFRLTFSIPTYRHRPSEPEAAKRLGYRAAAGKKYSRASHGNF